MDSTGEAVTISVKKWDRQVFTASVASGAATVDVTGGALSCPADGTMLCIAYCVYSHFSAGHQDAGGTEMAAIAVEGKNGVYSAIPVQATGSGPIGANPDNGTGTVPPTADTIIAGTGGLIPPTAVWAISGAGVVTLTIANKTGSTAGFDIVAFVEIFTAVSS